MLALRAFLTCFALLSCTAAPVKQNTGSIINCEKLSSSFCDPQFGCQIDTQADLCFFDATLPTDTINCTQSLIDVRCLNNSLNTFCYSKYLTDDIFTLFAGRGSCYGCSSRYDRSDFHCQSS